MKFMSHLVLGYPSLAASIETAEQYIAAGHAILELQIPFSHPTADGPVITQACRKALAAQNITVEDCMEAIQVLRARYPEQEIMVMTYLNRLYTYGVTAFCAQLETLGVRHIVVPDLPVDSPLAKGLVKQGVQLVPVLAANIESGRLEKIMDMGYDFYYLMSDFKITGSGFSLHPDLQQVVKTIRTRRPAARVGIGFGIATAAQARAVLDWADYAIIGSALIKAQEEGQLQPFLRTLATV
jgi:tryptophan synthase alpha chain